jgi:hypothetical protein
MIRRDYHSDGRGQLRGRTGPLVAATGLAIVASLLATGPARATVRLYDLGVGKLELSGNVQTTNIVRHPDFDLIRYPGSFDRMQFIQQRNVLRTRVDWELINGGRLFDKFGIPGVRGARLFLLYRFAYDSIYDYTPNVAAKYDVHGRNLQSELAKEQSLGPFAKKGATPRLLKLDSLTEADRDVYKLENRLREVYLDLKFRRIPLSLRIGQQQVVWGEADYFRMLDRANPLDVTWHFAQEVPPPSFGWDEIRRPLFMVKGLYDMGEMGPLSQMFLEAYWNPGDWYPVKIAFLPRPWGIPILDPLNNPWDGAFQQELCVTSESGCNRLMNDTVLFKQGNYDRWDPLDNSQLGIRFHASTPQGLEFTLNYLHQRWSGDDGTPFAPIRSLRVFNLDHVPLDPASQESRRLIDQGILPAEYIAPYVNTLGFSANYAEEEYTQTVYRLETILDFGIPFYDRGKRTVLDDWLPGVTEKNMWKGMIGFDRSTWIRSLNRKSSFLLTGQFFWHHVLDNPGCPNNLWDPNARKEFQKNDGHCLVGALDLPTTTWPMSKAFRDKIRDWELLANLALVGFYRGGSVIPVFAIVTDPANKFVGEAIWSVDYFVTPNVAFNVAQRLFMNPTGDKDVFDPWGFGTLSRGRSETSLRLTYQF